LATITGDTQVGSGPGPPGSGQLEELLYESERTRVTRIWLPNGAGAVIRKEPLGPGAAHRLRHELAMLERLAGVDGIPQLAPDTGPDSRHPDAITLVDAAGVALAAAIAAAPLQPAELVSLVLDLSRVVAGMHRRGVMHKDINPANIVVSGSPRRPSLIDFDLATTFAEERPGFTHQNKIVGTLAYLAPEQTGRTGRPVDQRADLYGLGATLYELATGQPPFGTGDPLRLTHDHLARVPVPPAEVNPALPVALSDIILRLLEKEPDRRYQSAEGLAHDLARVAEPGRAGSAGFPLGERDFPLRLSPPSRLVGRDHEIGVLQTAFAAAVAGRGRGVLVSGVPGVGKTALVDELRSAAAARGGWFVTGKFDQYRPDLESDAVRQGFRALGRLLLAEPEDELAGFRTHLLHRLGRNAGLAAAVVPEFALLLGVAPDTSTGDPQTARARLQQVGLDLLHAIATPRRPVVMVVDDLQWAGPSALGFVDAALSDGELHGLLLVGAFREAEVDAGHPLTPMLRRWEQLDAAPERIRLRNLPPAELGTLLAEMLRLPAAEAARLAAAIGDRTDGNPYDTVEMVNALRRDGALVPGPDGWTWDAGTLRRHIGHGDVADLLATRMRALPAPTQALLEIVACLGTESQLDLVQAASSLPGPVVEERLLPALEDGLLVMEQAGHDAVRFRHDRVQQAAYGRLSPPQRRDLHLAIARRLAARPALALMAAEQYLSAVDGIGDLRERAAVAVLFRAAATRARLLTPAMSARFLTEALALLSPTEAPTDNPLVAVLETELHAVLYSLGRLDAADEVYRSIGRRRLGPLDRADAACVQISSLTIRERSVEAVAVGLEVLRQLGVAVPTPQQVGAEIERGLEALHRWAAEGSEADDLRRPEITDPRVIAVGTVISRMMPPAFFSDQQIMAWLTVESGRTWAEHGPAAALVGPLSHATHVTIPLSGDYRTGERVMRRVLAVAEARGYEPEASRARFLYALAAAAWFEALESGVRQAHRACEGLIQGGDLQNACSTFHASLPQLLDCAPTLDALLAEVETALALATRTGNTHATAGELPYRQLVRALRGETDGLGSFADPSFDEAAYSDELAVNASTAAMYRATRALAAAIFGNSADLARHAAAGIALAPLIPALYSTVPAHLLQALALAERIRLGPPVAAAGALAELDACQGWLAARAADAPGNFRHLVRLVEAERAWALDDFRAAAAAFDAALREVTPRQRPWQQALITERAALFHLTYGLEHTGRALLGQAQRCYEAWGATAKVRELGRQYPFLAAQVSAPTSGQRPLDPQRSAIYSTETIDLLAVLKASQALSSETNLDRLRGRVVEVLSAMTGATTVWVVLRKDGGEGWVLPAPAGAAGTGAETTISVEEAGAQGLLPLSAFRYAERTREPLLIEDATRDDRFARDPYVAGLTCCSLLVVPILIRGALHAVVLLENRLSRSAFTADRLDGVILIAGQLAVSFDNALVYASLERKVAQRTEALAESNARLEVLSVTDPLTGLANRRRLADVLDQEWRRSVRPGNSVAVAMIDIDHFKPYNDHYGHAGGDECLRRVADVLTESVRDTTDLVARYGGEEFAVVVPGADSAAAYLVAERIRAAVAALQEPHELAPRGFVTVSIGVAAVIASADGSPQSLMEAADANLYEAKRNGRNQVRTGPATVPPGAVAPPEAVALPEAGAPPEAVVLPEAVAG
jgi:diguanylate cyclase (GGDEF)-like protein